MTQASNTRDPLAIALILASVFAMAFADAVVKSLSGDITLWQIFAARSLIAAAILVVMIRFAGTRVIPDAIGWTVLRSGLLVTTWLLVYAALPLLDLATVSVGMYVAPVLIVLFSGLIWGDRVSGRQWIGVLIGFAGVIVISRPGTEGFSWAVFLPVLGATAYSFAMLLTREKCASEHPLTLSLGMAVIMLITGIIGCAAIAFLAPGPETVSIYPFVLGPWVTLTGTDWAILALLALLIALYGAGVAKAYQIGTSSVVATFDYGYLISAAIWGFLFFSEVPDEFTIAGMALITAAGLLVLKRSGRSSD